MYVPFDAAPVLYSALTFCITGAGVFFFVIARMLYWEGKTSKLTYRKEEKEAHLHG